MIRPSLHRTLRRAAVTVGVVASLVAGAATIRAAAAWTAAEAPLTAPPVSIAALGAADERLAVDQAEADALRERLTGASDRLVRLNRELAAVRRAAAAAKAAAAQSAGAAAPVPAREHDDEEDEDHDD